MKVYIWIFSLLFFQMAYSTEKNTEQTENVSDKTGWTYVGHVIKSKWNTKYLDVEFPEFESNPNEDLEHHYTEPKEVKVLAPVTLREDHIQFVNGDWIDQKFAGEICKDQVLNIISLKRVAWDDGKNPEEFDGFWWAKVSGDIGSVCK